MALTLEDYRTALRAYVQDHAGSNRILKFVQDNTNDELDLYINMALGFLNGIPPLIGEYSYSSFPIPSLLIHQATIECLISNGIVLSRNDLTYNNGGITVRISDGDTYLRQLQMLYRVTDQEISSLVKLKIALNIYGGFGGVYSPYVRLHGTAASLQPNTIF
jgi:hypothetical protein